MGIDAAKIDPDRLNARVGMRYRQYADQQAALLRDQESKPFTFDEVLQRDERYREKYGITSTADVANRNAALLSLHDAIRSGASYEQVHSTAQHIRDTGIAGSDIVERAKDMFYLNQAPASVRAKTYSISVDADQPVFKDENSKSLYEVVGNPGGMADAGALDPVNLWGAGQLAHGVISMLMRRQIASHMTRAAARELDDAARGGSGVRSQALRSEAPDGISIFPEGADKLDRLTPSIESFGLRARINAYKENAKMIQLLKEAKGKGVYITRDPALNWGDAITRSDFSLKTMGDITRATGKEVGLFRVGRELRLTMGRTSSVAPPPGATRLLAHTHPSGNLSFSLWREIEILEGGLISGRNVGDVIAMSKLFPRAKSSIIVGPSGAAARRQLSQYSHLVDWLNNW